MVGDQTKISYKNVYISTVIINFVYFGAGGSNVWTSSAIPRLREPTSRFYESGFNERVLVSCFAAGQILGPMIGGCFMDSIGRKATTFMMILFLAVSYILLEVAPTVELLYAGRVIGGFTFGMSVSVLPAYVAEISDVHTRGLLNSLPLATRSFGYFATYAVGPLVSYTTLNLLSLICPVLALILVFLLPESPYYLFSKGRLEKAEATIRWLRTRASCEQLMAEITTTKKAVEDMKVSKGGFRDLLSTRANIRALYISCSLLFFLQMSGIPVFMPIAQSMFELSHISLSSQVCTLMFGGIMLIVGLMGPSVTRRFGYKGPLIVSALGMAFSLIVFGGHFYLIHMDYDTENLGMVALISFIAYVCFYSLGVSNCAFSVVGEVFSPNVKAVGTSLTNSVGFAWSLLSIQLFYGIKSFLGIHYGIWFFAVINAVAVPFTCIFVPNTSKMSLVEIQDLLNRPWFDSRNKVEPVEMYTISDRY